MRNSNPSACNYFSLDVCILFLYSFHKNRGGVTSECKFGNMGPICGVCNPGFARNALNECGECYDPAKNLAIILLIFLAAFLAVMILILYKKIMIILVNFI